MGNFSNPSNISSLVGLSDYVNTVTIGWFWGIMLMTFFVVLYLGFNMFYSKEDALVGSSFVGLLLAFMLKGADLVGDWVLFLMGILLMIGFVLIYQNKEIS